MPNVNNIYYTLHNVENTKPTIVLIHGAGSNRLCWPAHMRRFKNYRTVTIDLPGHGRSQNCFGLHSIESYSTSINDLLISIGVYEIILIGHSMGGAIALDFAKRYPEQVRALTLISTGAFFSIGNELVQMLSNPSTIQGAIQLIGNKGFSPKSSKQLIELSMKSLHEVRPGVLAGDWTACAQFDMRDKISEIKQPTLIIVGEDDQITPIGHSRYLAECMKNAQLSIIPDAGHMVILEQFDKLFELIYNFLSNID